MNVIPPHAEIHPTNLCSHTSWGPAVSSAQGDQNPRIWVAATWSVAREGARSMQSDREHLSRRIGRRRVRA